MTISLALEKCYPHSSLSKVMEEVALDVVEGGEYYRRSSSDLIYNYMASRIKIVSDSTKESTRIESSDYITISKVVWEEKAANIEEMKDEDHPYDPRIISIGPLHHGKSSLQPMEELKWSYLHDILMEKGKMDDLKSYIQTVRSKLKDAKNRYANRKSKSSYDDHHLDGDDELTMMLVLDGIFLIQFLIKSRFPRYDDPNSERYMDVVDDLGWKLPWIKHDILLLENQLPFFILQDLYSVFYQSCCGTKLQPVGIFHSSMVDVATDYFLNTQLLDQQRCSTVKTLPPILSNLDTSHLLHVYHALIFKLQPEPSMTMSKYLQNLIPDIFFKILFGWILFLYPTFSDNIYPTMISTATEMEEAGVKFEGSFMDLCFRDNILYVPIFSLNYQSFTLLKNLIALEVSNSKIIPPYIYSYAEFLTDLIKTDNDLKIMEEKNIIRTESKQMGKQLVEKLLKGVELKDMYFDKNKKYRWQRPRERIDGLVKFAENPCHRWRRDFVKEYFSSPWSFIGLAVGALIVIFTAFQTIYSILPYYFRR